MSRPTETFDMSSNTSAALAASLTPESLAARIDHAFLKAYGKPSDIEQLCNEARTHGFAMVAINPAEVETCVKLLEDTKVRVGAAIGFPLGQNTVAVKEYEIQDALARGAGEIDMVINVRALQAGNVDLVAREIQCMVALCQSHAVVSKVILETCCLSDEQKREVCRIAVEQGAQFVKTSTGFGSGGATLEDVALMHEAVAGRAEVKASGGIRSLQQVVDFIAAGATRIGTSNGVAILNELRVLKRP